MDGFKRQVGGAWLLALTVCLAAAGPVQGLIQHPGDEGDPAVRPPDAAVGRWAGNASCVPVGPNYVITTRHQGHGVGWPVTIGGVEYLVAEVFDHAQADLRVVRLTLGGLDADLADYTPVYTGTDEHFKNVVIGGWGQGRGDLLKTPGQTVYGYAWTGAFLDQPLRWGANRIEDTSEVGDGTYTSKVITADFDGAGGSAYRAREAAPAKYDSGGGWFIDVSPGGTGDWRVAGLTRGVEHGEPISQSWFRNSLTGVHDPDYLDAVRLSSYAGFINGVINTDVWRVDSSGLWSAAANWSAGVPNGTDTWAALGDAISADRTVTVDTAVTLGTLRIDDNDRYTLDGTGSLTFNVATGLAGIEVNRQAKFAGNGAHTIGVPITLAAPLVLNTRSSGDLILAGAIFGSKSITKCGEGTAVLAATNPFYGGLVIEEGTVRGTAPGALGTGEVTLKGGSIDLRYDADAAFAGTVRMKSSATANVNALVAGTGRTLSVGALNVEGNQTLTVTGGNDYWLGVTGATVFTGVTGVATVNTASANLLLAGGMVVTTGSIGKTGPGTLAIGGAQYYGSAAAMTVAGGTVRFNSDAGPGGLDNLAVSVTSPGAAVAFGATQHLANLTVSAGTAQVLSGAPHVVATRGLSIDASDSRLDLAEGGLILSYTGSSPMTQVSDWVRTGLNRTAGYWDGFGITSSTAAGATLTAVGVIDNTDPSVGGKTTFMGQTVPDATSILARYTWWGDANLDGVVNSNDYDRIDTNWLLYGNGQGTPPGGFRWSVGDFNYDGLINSNDYDLIDRAWLLQGSPLMTADGPYGFVLPTAEVDFAVGPPATLGVVPEPATIALLAAGALAVVGRRRRRPAASTPR